MYAEIGCTVSGLTVSTQILYPALLELVYTWEEEVFTDPTEVT